MVKGEIDYWIAGIAFGVAVAAGYVTTGQVNISIAIANAVFLIMLALGSTVWESIQYHKSTSTKFTYGKSNNQIVLSYVLRMLPVYIVYGAVGVVLSTYCYYLGVCNTLHGFIIADMVQVVRYLSTEVACEYMRMSEELRNMSYMFIVLSMLIPATGIHKIKDFTIHKK